MVPADESNPDSPRQVRVDSVAFGGNGVARLEGKVIFVNGTIPGDLVEIEVTEDKGRYCHAKVTKFVEPSTQRGPSPCIYSDRCGGCQWQGITYEEQLKWKLNFVTSAIARIGGLKTDEISICPSPQTLNYRNRIHLKAHWHRNLKVGYFAERSHQLIDIKRCMIAADRINAIIPQLYASAPAAEHPLEFRFEAQQIINPTDPNRDLVITVFPNQRQDSQQLRRIIEAWRAITEIAWVGFLFETKDAPYFVIEEWEGIKFHTKPGVFQQVNLAANQLLRRYVNELVLGSSPKRVLDLYSGSGNFSLPLARVGVPIEGSEFNRQSIDCANENRRVNNIENAVYLAGDSVAHARRIEKSKKGFSHIIADPPRDGMHNAVNPILNIAADQIIYISCDPTTLARDLGKLCSNKYRIRSIRAFDFFPNTYHVESVVQLERT